MFKRFKSLLILNARKVSTEKKHNLAELYTSFKTAELLFEGTKLNFRLVIKIMCVNKSLKFFITIVTSSKKKLYSRNINIAPSIGVF